MGPRWIRSGAGKRVLRDGSGNFEGWAVDWEDAWTALWEVDVCVGDGSYDAG
jgi:hypothetical protein